MERTLAFTRYRSDGKWRYRLDELRNCVMVSVPSYVRTGPDVNDVETDEDRQYRAGDVLTEDEVEQVARSGCCEGVVVRAEAVAA